MEKFGFDVVIISCSKVDQLKQKRKERKVELHIFADDSSKAYGAAAYVNVINTNSKHCYLVLAKSKIAPMKNKLTIIRRLELQAALLASRIKLIVT